jgi:hypothetical protein
VDLNPSHHLQVDADLLHIETQLAALALQKRKAEAAASTAAAAAAKHAGLLGCSRCN